MTEPEQQARVEAGKSEIMNIIHHLLRFEAWFNRRFGWFFTNGRKHRTWK